MIGPVLTKSVVVLLGRRPITLTKVVTLTFPGVTPEGLIGLTH